MDTFTKQHALIGLLQSARRLANASKKRIGTPDKGKPINQY